MTEQEPEPRNVALEAKTMISVEHTPSIGCHSDFVEIGSELSEQNLTLFEPELCY